MSWPVSNWPGMILRRRSLAVRACLAVALVSLAAAAAPGLASDAGPKGSPGPGYVKTDNVERVLTLPLDTDSIGARVFEKNFYLRTAKGVTIYDTTNPELPTPKGFVAVPATPNQERENIDTNGEILVTGQAYDGILYVIDVRNKTTPTIISATRGAADHTNTCALKCTFVYGSEGTITDLRNPAAPKVVGKWFGPQTQAGFEGVSGSHDLTEVRPGILVTASNPLLQLDVNENPTAPTVTARGTLPDNRYMHGVEWPNGGTDRFLLAGSETSLGCQAELGSFVVWDTLPVRTGAPVPPADTDRLYDKTQTPAFTRTGQYTLGRGLPTDLEGKAPASQHCGHWFTEHPEFENGGLVAMGWYTSGVRFLEVTPTGTVEERGFWQPLPGVSSAAFWVSEDIVWVTDYTARGIDVLRFDRDAAPQSDASAPGRFIAAGSAAEARGAALVNAAHEADHHTGTSVADLADAWVCKPVGGPAPVGAPVALGAGLLGTG
jgi:hypothetical protein